MRRRSRSIAFLLFFASIFVRLSYGQVDAGTISGVVSDANGSVISGATVRLENVADHAMVTLTTNREGVYSAPSLHAGTYDISANAKGFRTITRKGVDLRVQDRLAIDLTLAVGSADTTVFVTSTEPPLETETSSVGHVVEQGTIQALPLNGRNAIQLATLAPGTTPAQRTQERNTFISNGQRSIQNSYLLDGVDNKNKIVGFDNSTAQSVEPIVDAIQEFKVQTSTFSAEFGQSAGAVINATLRSGGDQFHGSVFEYIRNSAVDASPFFQPALTAKPQFIQNQFGATLGGPIWKNHTFFFVAWQSSRIVDAAPQLANVPTLAQRSGIFSKTIYDPATTSAKGSSYSRAQFAGNQIPASRFDSVAARLLALYPAPNLTGTFNYLSNQTERVDSDQYIIRLDHHLSAKDSFFSHFVQVLGQNTLPATLPPPASNPSIVKPEAHSFVASETHIFSPSLVNEARVGYQETRERQNINSPRLFDQFGIIGAPNDPTVSGLPTFAISGLTTVGSTGPGTLLTPATGSGNLPIDKQGRTIQASDNLTWQLGRHSLKFGVDMQQVTLYANSTLNARPAYNFNGSYTQDPQNRSTTGDPFADFLLGYTSSSTVSTRSLSESRQHIYQGYVQDDWKATKKLALNLGVRYEVPLPFYETSNHYSNLILENNSLHGTILDASNAGQAGYRRSFSDPNYRNFAPRVGFAYQINSATVLHSAFGIFYGRDENVPVARRPTNNPPYFIQTSYTSDQINPGIILATGFPADAVDPSNVKTPAVNSYPKDMPTPYVQQWSLSLQRQLPGETVAQVSYVGSGTHRLYYPLQIDQPRPGAGAIQARRPLPQYSAVYEYGPFIGSHYGSLQAQLERRMSHGLYFLAAYTWGHSIDNGSSQVDTSPAPQDSQNLAAERGNSNFDVRNRFVASAVYDLPFGKGRSFGSGSRLVSALFGGITAKAIFSVQGGIPFTPTEAVDQSNTGTTARPQSSGQRQSRRWPAQLHEVVRRLGIPNACAVYLWQFGPQYSARPRIPQS
ncbi:MAG: TonB-dependent receptor [Edaphobacter sp.]|uniref:TonB-dependent receptor n=1 Tax=Edaphobacter sp. TaxID=1934404 RepID=UPI0023908EDE|nr:carboxypeptidase regulatory-like domain-containing protein [Edaphobacter sp.]MDE1175680.1 TonB-dependent receptor [Edaphobacter sp.]